MTFDEKLKARAEREGAPIPKGFDSRMDALLDNLPAGVQSVKKRRAPRLAVCIGVAAAMVVGAAAAAPAVLEMARNAIDYFDQNEHSEYADYQGKYEKYNAAVGISDTNGDQTLTIDNIAVDDSYMSIFYTLSSETPIEQAGTESDPESWRAEWTAPVFWANVDGEMLDTSGAIENEAYFVDDCTLKGMHRLVLKESLPDQFDLLLYTGDSVSSPANADFQFALAVDKSTVGSLTAEPALDFTVDYTGTYEDGSTYSVHRTPRIERVSISPLSSTITLSEKVPGDELMPFDGFVLRDSKGNYLTRLPAGMSADTLGRSVNVFEFIGADETTKSVTLIPIKWSYHFHTVKGALDALPLTDACANGLTLESLEVGADRTVATFSVHGIVWEANGQFDLTDAGGNTLDFSKDSYFDSYTDRETGKIIATLYYPDATEAELSRIAGVSFWQPDDDMVLLEDQAVTIDLQ